MERKQTFLKTGRWCRCREEGRRGEWTAAQLSAGPGRARGLQPGAPPAWAVHSLSFASTAAQRHCTQIPLGCRRPWAAFSPGWGVETWSHIEVTRPENGGISVAKDSSQ